MTGARPIRLLMRICLLAGALGAAACGPRYSREYWIAYQANLELEGKLRTERVPADAPFTDADLAENFSKTAFGLDPEFLDDLGEEARADIDVIRRWIGPIRYAVYGGLTASDRQALGDVTRRISRASGLSMTEVADPAAADWNMGIYVFGYEERQAFLSHLRAEEDEALYEVFAGLFSDELICSGTMLRRTDPDGNLTGEIGHALVFIRAELPATLRRSCIEEELTQGMGLIRDDDAVRPSLFNEDEEFALMTLHDELLMQILYDPRLKPGMSKAEAMPIVRRIAGELELPARF